MVAVYFDSSVFLDIFKPNTLEHRKALRDFLAELKATNTRIHTSVITIQEVSVYSFLEGVPADDNYRKVSQLARIHNITEKMALTAAKMEAKWIDSSKKAPADNKRRKWDCFHVATALTLGCGTLYTADRRLMPERFGVSMRFALPRSMSPMLPFGDSADTMGKTPGATPS